MHTKELYQNWKPPKPEHNIPTPWNWVVAYPDNLVIGKYVDIGAFVYLQAERGILLEDHVEIGSHCSIYSVNTIDNIKGAVFIEENAKIGSHSTVLPGVTIGENSKVGAHSLVKHNVPDNTIVAGVPARKIGDNYAELPDTLF